MTRKKANIEVQVNANVEKALRQLKKKIEREGVVRDMKRTVYFYSALGHEHFQKLMPTLILYKPTLRHALSQAVPGRYTPDLIFKFDAEFEKQQHLDALLDKIKAAG